MKLINAPYIDQSIKYPTGCESVSAVMLLQYLGYDIAVDDFIGNLPKAEFQTVNGVLHGPDPRTAFAGSPYDKTSYGCYAPVIAKALQKIVEPEYSVCDETGASIPLLLEKYIDRDMPVVLWACIDMKAPVIGPSWRISSTGKLFTWLSNEHCMLLVGYDDTHYYFNDPHENHGLTPYPRELTQQRHLAQGAQAVSVKKCG